MNVTEHQRPGVYSVYDASSAVSGRRGGGWAGVAAVCPAGSAGEVYPLSSAEEARAAFGDGAELAVLAELLGIIIATVIVSLVSYGLLGSIVG